MLSLCYALRTLPSTTDRGGKKANRICARFGDREDVPSQPSGNRPNRLADIVKRKQAQIEHTLKELGMEGLEERLKSGTETPSPHPYQLAALIAEIVPTGRPILVFEVARPLDDGSTSTSTSKGASAELASTAARLLNAGADALLVPIDSDDTPQGLADFFAVSREAAKVVNSQAREGRPVPVLLRDWFIHPLQVVDAKEAGCAGVVGVVASITGQGSPILSSFAAALGLDCPVEIVNLKELEAMEGSGVPFYGLNTCVGLTTGIAGFGNDVAKGLLGNLPFGAISLVGIKWIEEARALRVAGADALLIKKELVQAERWRGKEVELVESLLYTTSLDD